MKHLLFNLFTVFFFSCISSSLFAQNDYGYFNSLAGGVSVGVDGIGLNLSSRLGDHFDVRLGALYMPGISISKDVDLTQIDGEKADLDLKGSLERFSGQFLIDYYPFKTNDFFITTGIVFPGKKLSSLEGHSDELRDRVNAGEDIYVGVKDCVFPVDKHGDMYGGLEVFPVRPYIGFGYGNAVPRKHVGYMIELGIQVHGTPEVYSDIESNQTPTYIADDSFTKTTDKLKVYPVLKFTLTGRFL